VVVRFVRGSQFASVSCAAVALLQRPLRLLGFSAPAPAVFELQTERTAIKLFVWHPGRVFCFCGYTEKKSFTFQVNLCFFLNITMKYFQHPSKIFKYLYNIYQHIAPIPNNLKYI